MKSLYINIMLAIYWQFYCIMLNSSVCLTCYSIFCRAMLDKMHTFHKVALIWFSPQMFNSSNITTECPDAECLFAFYGGETLYHKYLILFQFYNLFLFFWCANFVTALGQVTLAGAFASYYWAFKKPDDIPAYPIFNSLGRALRCVMREIVARF